MTVSFMYFNGLAKLRCNAVAYLWSGKG